MIYDDYAHNPTKIKSVLNAIHASSPQSYLVVIFQPHRHSRIKTLYNNFVGSFVSADFVIVLPTYSSGEQDDNPIPSARLTSDIEKNSRVPSCFADSFEKAQELVAQTIKKDSIIITLGAGDVWRLAFILKERLS
jgi:UDP-N-acetylmuramate--alanine ligase